MEDYVRVISGSLVNTGGLEGLRFLAQGERITSEQNHDDENKSPKGTNDNLTINI